MKRACIKHKQKVYEYCEFYVSVLFNNKMMYT